MQFKINLIVLIGLVFLLNHKVSSQENQIWRKIIPSVSTCSDVKKILKVNECNTRILDYKFPKYNVVIVFSDGENKWNVPKGIVTTLNILFTTLPFLNDIETDLHGYKITPEYNLPDVKIYTNDSKGTKIVVERDSVSSLTFYPPTKKIKRNMRKKLNE